MDDFSDCESTQSIVAHTKHDSAIKIENTKTHFFGVDVFKKQRACQFCFTCEVMC